MKSLVNWRSNLSLIIPRHGANKDGMSRLRRFVDWMQEYGRYWWDIDLMAYRDFLLSVGGNDGNGLAPLSAQAHLSTIRARYRDLLRDNRARAEMFAYARASLRVAGQEDSAANVRAVVEEMRTAIQDAIHPDSAPVQVITDQDPDYVRLTVEQANALLRAPDNRRDRAVIGLLLATGIREGELCDLEARDLRARMDDGALALRVQHGKGNKARKIPYGEMVSVLTLVDAWLQEAGISSESGRVSDFRARVFDLSVRTVQRIVARYPVFENGRPLEITPHTLRRTYARRLYESGVSLAAIQQNMGHADIRTTMHYVGELDGKARQPGAVFDFS